LDKPQWRKLGLLQGLEIQGSSYPSGRDIPLNQARSLQHCHMSTGETASLSRRTCSCNGPRDPILRRLGYAVGAQATPSPDMGRHWQQKLLSAGIEPALKHPPFPFAGFLS